MKIRLVPILAALSLFALFAPAKTAKAQFVLSGDAVALGGDCFRITPNLLWQTGSVWHPDLIDLNRDFSLRVTANFGNLDVNGADGLAFLLQPLSTGIGVSGGGMGYEGISPSLGVEFDTYENIPYADPFSDHIAIQRDGNLDHTGSAALISPVNISATSSNIEDGNDHTILIDWNASTTTLTVEVDCSMRASYTGNIISTIFGGDPEVYIGFTGSTGGLSNEQTLCFDFLEVGEGPDTLEACTGSSIVIPGPDDFLNYSWSPSTGLDDPTIANPTASPASNTLYVVTFEDDCGNAYTDSFFVELVSNIEVDLGPDTAICGSETVILGDPDAFGAYVWSDGSTGSTLEAGPGTYWLQVNPVSGCPGADTIVVTDLSPSVDLGDDISFCTGDSVLIGVPDNPDWIFTWSNGLGASEIWVSQTGQLSIEVDWDGCVISDTIFITQSPLPEVVLPDSVSACINELLEIGAGGDAESWFWSTGNQGQVLSYLYDGVDLIWVDGMLDGCVSRDTAYVFEAEFCACQPVLPNAFSPNQDGLNDRFQVLNISACPPQEFFLFQIFNRWGEVVFSTRDSAGSWDGTFKGRPAPVGSYVWTLEAQFGSEELVRSTGGLTLIR